MTLGPDLALDPTSHDLVFENGDLLLRADLAQAIKCAILAVRGEWFLDELDGVPYFEDVFVKKPSLAQLAAIYRDTIARVPAVREVKRLSVRLNADRSLAVEWAVEGDAGEISGTTEVG